jgi:diguanylate cyclase (GGDEF)-like protein
MGKPGRGARIYIGLSFAIASFLSIWQFSELWLHSEQELRWPLAGIAIAAAALSLFRVFGSSASDNYDVAWVLYGYALIDQGAAAAIIVIILANLATLLARRYSWPWYVHVFNISSFVIAACLAYGARMALLAWISPADVAQVVGIIVAIALFTVANHAHVAGVLWFSERVTPAKSGLFSRSSLSVDATLLGVGALAALVAELNPFAVLLVIAPLYLIHSAMRVPRLEKQALTDAKTGLFHSRQFTVRAEQEFVRAQRLSRPLALTMIDLDFLRDVNNTHGHLAGDVAIRAVAEVLKSCAREDDIVARFGGEEFAFLMVEHDHALAALRAEAIRAAIEAATPVLPNGTRIRITASLGFAQLSGADADLAALISRADAALYQAKNSGRNCVRAASGSSDETATTQRVYGIDEAELACPLPIRAQKLNPMSNTAA